MIKNILESKAFIMGLLSTAAAVGAVAGFNIPVTTIIALLTPIMVGIGAQGWSDAVKMKAKMALEHDVKMHALVHGNTTDTTCVPAIHRDADGRAIQRGSVNLGMSMIATIVIAALFGGIMMTSSGCPTVKPIATDIIECADAEATAISDGYSIIQIFSAVIEAIKGGPSTVLADLGKLIGEYGPNIVACAIDNYPEPAVGRDQGREQSSKKFTR